MKPEPFRIQIPQADLDDLRYRLGHVRWAADFGNADWSYGVERTWLEDMVAYWRNSFDWRAQEARMNQYPHFRVEIDGIPLHFLHVRGKGPAPKPLILTHGWPWTFWDYKDLIGPLSDPAAHGGRAEDAFDLVVPSLPGFGFSTPLRTTGVDVARIAALWVSLMRDMLGYSRFGAAGGDWGAGITNMLGHAYPEFLAGCYATLVWIPGMEITGIPRSAYADDELWMKEQSKRALPSITSHVAVHTSDPQTLAYALADSPVGTAAWLWERRRAWSDCGGDVLSVFDRDCLCTLASVYWLTGTITTSMRLYAEQFRQGQTVPAVHTRMPAIEVPTGFALFPREVSLLPRAIAQKYTNLRRWSLMSAGGHFGPAEQPAAFVHELREFFRELD